MVILRPWQHGPKEISGPAPPNDESVVVQCRVVGNHAQLATLRSRRMEKMTKSYAALVACLLLTAAPAHAQSSGNFTYGTAGGTTACTLASNGVISGGVQCSMSCNI